MDITNTPLAAAMQRLAQETANGGKPSAETLAACYAEPIIMDAAEHGEPITDELRARVYADALATVKKG